MNQYGVSSYGIANPNPLGYGNPFAQQQFGLAGIGTAMQPRFGQGFGSQLQNPGEQVPSFGTEYGNIAGQFSQQHISPEQFAGSIGRQQIGASLGVSPVDASFITELVRTGRGLVEVAEQVETREPEAQRRAIFAATAHLFYAFGLLSSRGIFIPADLPISRTRTEAVGAATAVREFGKQLERLVDRYASGRGVFEELGNVVERGKLAYWEVTRVVEGTEATGEQQGRKKAA